jgi:hypothetical protein
MSEVSHQLHRETEAAKALRANLADIIGNDEQCAADMIEAETDLNEAIDAAVRMLIDDLAAMNGLNEMIDLLVARKDRIEGRIGHYRTALATAMEQAGRKNVEHPAVTLSLRPSPPAVRVTDEAAVPSKFWEASAPRLNKRALLAALKDRETVPGACLNNPGFSLTLRWD